MFVRTVSGVAIPVAYYEYPDSEFTLVFSHGNACNLYQIEHSLVEFRNRFRCSIVGYDYAGYGHSKHGDSVALNSGGYDVFGRPIDPNPKPVPSETGCYESADAVFNYVTNTLKKPPESQIWVGESVGSGPVVDLVCRLCLKGERKVAAMILVNPFWSVTQVVSSVLPWIVDMFRNGSKIGAIDIPTMIISSEADEVIPAVHREWLHDKCKNSHIVKLPGARHNDALIDNGALVAIFDFISVEVKRNTPVEFL